MAASNYNACLAKILKYEGGYVNDPHDPGGETNYGITVAVARACGYHGDMHAIPMDLVRSIYRKNYWDVVNGDGLPAGLDLCVFDYAVNSGPGRANPARRTLAAGTVREQINAYCDIRLAFLQRLKTWPRYGKGWGRRVADVRATALQMAEGVPQPAPKPAPQPDPLPEREDKSGGNKTPTILGALGMLGAAIAAFVQDHPFIVSGGLLLAVVALLIIMFMRRKK